jgi:hypothetical protein
MTNNSSSFEVRRLSRFSWNNPREGIMPTTCVGIAPDMHKIIQTLIRKLRPKPKTTKRLVVNDAGLTLYENEQEVYRFPWSAVTRIETYKVVLFSIDMICLDFWANGCDVVYRTDEEMVGFDELTDRLTHFFASIPADWWSEVAFPAFATNHRILYEKPGA